MKETSLIEDQKIVLRKLGEYWIKSSEAKDTLEGVCQSWLSEETAKYGVVLIQQALELMISKEWVSYRIITPARKIYSLKWVNEFNDFLNEG